MRFHGFEIFNKSCPVLKNRMGIGKKSISLMLAGNTNQRGRLSMIDLLIRVACAVKKLIMFTISQSADLN